MNVLAYGGQVTAIGLFMVFLALAILILCIYGLSWLLRKLLAMFKKEDKQKAAAPAPAPKADPAPVAAPAPVATPAPVVEEAAAEEAEVVTDPQVIAVIAAAIAACDANTKLVIRSVRRASGWQKAARNEAVTRF